MFYGFIFGQMHIKIIQLLAKHELDGGSKELWNAPEEERGYITDLNFTINGKKVDWRYHPEHIDICKLILNKPIKAGETVVIKTPFKVKIPNTKFSRLGHVGQSYMITQWYPKPAVYDKEGYIMPYLSPRRILFRIWKL